MQQEKAPLSKRGYRVQRAKLERGKKKRQYLPKACVRHVSMIWDAVSMHKKVSWLWGMIVRTAS